MDKSGLLTWVFLVVKVLFNTLDSLLILEFFNLVYNSDQLLVASH